MAMELRHLKQFLAVAEELHFGRAAERLQMAQAPLSQQIARLERELGVRLFQRTTRRVQLTDAGRTLLAEARLTLAQAERAALLTRRAGNGEIGHLAIAFVGSATFGLLPEVLRRFRLQCPGVELNLREMTSRPQVEALRKGQIDAGFLRPPVSAAGLRLETIVREPFVLVVPEDHQLAARRSVAVSELAHEAFVLFPRNNGGSLYDQTLAACTQAGFVPTTQQEAMEIPTILGLVAAGIGVSLVPASAQNLHRAGIVYKRLRDTTARAEMAVAWRADDSWPACHRFLGIVREVAGTILPACMPGVPGWG
jgi:DNA-binding transcriptional LysR family regulator